MVEEEQTVEGYSAETVEWSLIPELQRGILNLLMTDRDFFVQSVGLIKPEYFSDGVHAACYAAMEEYFREHSQLVTRAVLEQRVFPKFQGDDVESIRSRHELEMVYERSEEVPRERDYLLDEIVKFAKNQAMRAAILRAADLLPEERYPEIEEIIRQALLVGLRVDMGSFYFEDVEDRYASILATDSPGDRFNCVFDTIDRDLNGGLRAKEVAIIFSNKSGVGKSIFLANVAKANVFNGKKVLFVTLENSQQVTESRFDAMFAKIPTDQQQGRVDEVIAKVRSLQDLFPKSLIVKEFASECLGVDDLRGYLHQLIVYHNWKPDLIVLDYLDEMKMPRGSGDSNDYRPQLRITRQIRALAMLENIAIFTATQSNREGGYKQVATETELGDSYGKSRVVDALWSINQNDDERARGMVRLYVCKHRNARSKYVIYGHIDYATMTMREVTEAEYDYRMTQPPVAHQSDSNVQQAPILGEAPIQLPPPQEPQFQVSRPGWWGANPPPGA